MGAGSPLMCSVTPKRGIEEVHFPTSSAPLSVMFCGHPNTCKNHSKSSDHMSTYTTKVINIYKVIDQATLVARPAFPSWRCQTQGHTPECRVGLRGQGRRKGDHPGILGSNWTHLNHGPDCLCLATQAARVGIFCLAPPHPRLPPFSPAPPRSLYFFFQDS